MRRLMQDGWFVIDLRDPLSRLRHRSRAYLYAATGVALVCLVSSDASPSSVTGVCPDGSFFIVQDAAQIPCKKGKRVEPHEMPPIRPDYLPRPYTWQVYNESANPNNPYNLIDSARQVRALQNGGPPPAVSGGPPGAEGAQATAPHAAAAPAAGPLRPPGPRPTVGPSDLGLTDGELRDLFFIVELAQKDTPAEFLKGGADGNEALRVSLARSAAFESRLQSMWSANGAPASNAVLLFTAVSKRPETFHGNFTVTQGHLAAQIEPSDPHQMGVLQGKLGKLERDEVVLGYMVLPEGIDPTQPMDVYWDDRRITATF
jgi:hypothetical protein